MNHCTNSKLKFSTHFYVINMIGILKYNYSDFTECMFSLGYNQTAGTVSWNGFP